MTLDTGLSRQEAVGVVLGAAGEQHGLVLYPGREVPAILDDADRPRSLPTGTIALFLDDEGVPADLAAKAGRYGWPATADRIPVLLAWDGERRPCELDASMAAATTLSLAAVLDQDARRRCSGGRVTWAPGELALDHQPAARRFHRAMMQRASGWAHAVDSTASAARNGSVVACVVGGWLAGIHILRWVVSPRATYGKYGR